MTVKAIRILGDPVLHRPADIVETRADGSLPRFVDALVVDLYDTLAASKGVGLAAPQIGVGLRVFVYNCPEDRSQSERHRGVIVNPVLEASEVADRSADRDQDEEGCLSAPGVKFPIVRADWARVTGTDISGAKIEIQGTGLLARMLQHETAHLDGVLYFDELAEPHASEARQVIGANGWGVPGRSWTPGEVLNPLQN